MNKKFLSLVLSLVMVLGTFTSVFAASETVKKDEKATEKVEKVEKITGKDNKIQYIIDKKFVEGYGDGEFGYDKNIKRSEITKLLVFANGHKELSEKLQGTMKLYKDVDTAYWANGVIAVGTTVPSTSNNQAMLNGYPDGNFLPENNVTYAELSKMLVVLVKEDLTADDVKKANANWAGQWMSWAAQLGILDDVTVADSNAAATRADAFTMLYNALYKMQNFKREPSNEKLGILSALSSKKLTLNQDSEEEYTITDDTVFVKHDVNGKEERNNVVKVSTIKNPEYYKGSLVRIMFNDKKEITHILELGNPDKGALSNNKDKETTFGKETTIVKDNSRWDDVADATISTKMYNIKSLKNIEEKDIKSYAKLNFKDNKKTDVKTIEIIDLAEGKDKGIKFDVKDSTKIFVANPGNNQMKEVKDIYEAIRLIGYKDTLETIPNVYVGFNDDSSNSATVVNTDNNDLTAKVVVFNVVTKNNDKSEKYRVIDRTSSKGVSILEDVDGKKLEQNDFENSNRFPYNYGDLYDVIEVSYDATDESYDIETIIEHDDEDKFPIVEIVQKEDNWIVVKDEDKNEGRLDIRDTDVFTAKNDFKKGAIIQFALDEDQNNKADVISILPKNTELKGSIYGLIGNTIEDGQYYGKLISIGETVKEEAIAKFDIYRNANDTDAKFVGKRVTVRGEKTTKVLKDLVGENFSIKLYDDGNRETIATEISLQVRDKDNKIVGYISIDDLLNMNKGNVEQYAKQIRILEKATDKTVENVDKILGIYKTNDLVEELNKIEAEKELDTAMDKVTAVGVVELAKDAKVDDEAVKEAVEKQINNENVKVTAKLNEAKNQADITLTVGDLNVGSLVINVTVAK